MAKWRWEMSQNVPFNMTFLGVRVQMDLQRNTKGSDRAGHTDCHNNSWQVPETRAATRGGKTSRLSIPVELERSISRCGGGRVSGCHLKFVGRGTSC